MQRLESLDLQSSPANFDQLVELARTSSALRIAFDSDWQINMNRSGKVAFFRQELFLLHGIEPYFSEETEDWSTHHTLAEILKESLSDPDVWDALSAVVSEIVRDNLPLLPETREWASGTIAGTISRPAVGRGPHPLKYSARNSMVVFFLSHLEKYGVPITENEATHKNQSACDAISEGLGNHFAVPSPKTLMNIWSNRSQN
ncbi:hypothetical protein [Sulfitobacter mediterraneus]|nr:hypothetical protein [Sulfitobacter mediterraneus]MBM1634385.1 hypothetical protein [Sulfitobacter mediterraneus]MBM1650297.1 hypothetical protein [Sulfitobacter mediterraneus]MBM1662435.1 hypothetical protein [Sulfitobacter mediterraneus]MBM1670529.1 hypothetical protein [Sulfitobacter mediterraneus]MBM1678620.1 hypothetical protein [Sulfitobacter mediterraneus]